MRVLAIRRGRPFFLIYVWHVTNAERGFTLACRFFELHIILPTNCFISRYLAHKCYSCAKMHTKFYFYVQFFLVLLIVKMSSQIDRSLVHRAMIHALILMRSVHAQTMTDVIEISYFTGDQIHLWTVKTYMYSGLTTDRVMAKIIVVSK